MEPDSTNPPRNEGVPIAAPADLDYEVLRLIGRGGYGEVWLVRDKTGRHLACKVIYRQNFKEDRPYEREFEGIKKFEPVSRANESQVKILHVGRHDEVGYFYYIMELADDAVPGRQFDPKQYVPKNLHGELERCGRLPAGECVRIGLSLSAALENLHEHGLIHRDIKPANIIFVNGIPKLADIGLVSDRDMTVSYVGTEGYIPPEGPGSAPADVYGLGKVLYEMSTGKDRLEYPQLPDDLGEASARESLLELNAVIIKACDSNVRARYQSAGELHADLTLLYSGKSVRQRRNSEWRLRAIIRLGLAATVIAAIAIAVYIGFQKWPARSDAGASATEGLGAQSDSYKRTAESSAALARVCIRTGFEAIGADDYPQAEKLAREAQTVAKTGASPHLIDEAAFLSREAARCKNEYETVQPFAKILKEKPRDPEANLRVGKYMCLVKNDWETGLPMLALGNEAALCTVADMEIATADEASLGDAWWNLAEPATGSDKDSFQRRARTWYLKAIEKSQEPEKSQRRQQWMEKIKSVPSPAAQVHISWRVGKNQQIEIYADEVRWRLGGASPADRINQLLLGSLKGKGTPRIIKNCGATRLYPEAVDFSTAKLIIERKSKKGKATMAIAADHVTLTLSDKPAGTAEMDLTVTFGPHP